MSALTTARPTPGGSDDSQSSDSGVVQGHAYSLLRIAANRPGADGAPFDLMQLRNPHGHGGKEWTGAWSDGHACWDAHPAIKAELKPTDANDGTFWIAKEDFSREFGSINVCVSQRSVGERRERQPGGPAAQRV